MFPSLRKSAFTLIELLTVISVIGVLAAIAMGTLGRTRASAWTTTVVSNMRQLGIASVAYAADNNGSLPGPSGLGLFRGYTKTTSQQYSVLIGPYLGLAPAASLPSGTNVIVPQLVDPAFVAFKPNVTASTPQFVQNPGLPAPLAGRRPLGRSDGADAAKPPLTLLQFNQVSAAKRWILCPADQQVTGLTGSWMADLPPKPLHGNKRPRLYVDGRVASVEPTDP